MAAAHRALRSLLRSAELGSQTYHLRSPWVSRRKLASFAYVAEQYGYRYDGIFSPPTASAFTIALERLPDAQERAARTRERYPDAPVGGRLPGMRGGRGSLTPLPEARREVDLILARFLLEATDASFARKRARHVVITVAIWIAVVTVVSAFGAPSLSIFLQVVLGLGGGLAALLLGALALGRVTSRRTRERSSRLLADAGIPWPQDRTGR